MTLTKSATIRFFRMHGSKYTAMKITETIFTRFERGTYIEKNDRKN
jgi:hypothetical protein